jgi:hypothetical protein
MTAVMKNPDPVVKGGPFGLAVFVFAGTAMAILGATLGSMPAPQGSIALLMFSAMLGHVIYGIVVGVITGHANPLRA